MRRFFATALIAMTAVCAPLAFGGNQEEANRIAKTINAAYPQYTVEVAYKSGRVRLRGEVSSPEERGQITRLVSQIPGVQSVSADALQVSSGNAMAFGYGSTPAAAAPYTMPAVPAVEPQGLSEMYRTAQTAPFSANNMISPVSGEFNMNSSLETAPLQSLPANPEPFPTTSNRDNFRIDNYSAAPVASGNYSVNNPPYIPAANDTIYAQNSYGPAPQGIPVAAGRNGQNGEPNLPNYAWPTTADYPNYSQVGYPKQYAASAFPYIGPFYPYPQVPLGWRKVTMEWHDGYWWLDFNDGSVNGPFSPLFRQPTKYR